MNEPEKNIPPFGNWSNKILQRRKSQEQRFLEKIDKTSSPKGCWLWLGQIDRHGYGIGWKDGRAVKAHRLAWEMHYGPIPEGKIACHHCDNPPCVRPEHIFLGTPADNASDREVKGRGIFGATHHKAKLNEATVIEIRAAYKSGTTIVELGKIYNVWSSTIWMIVIRKTWRHI